MEDDNRDFVSLVTTDSYACPNMSARDLQRRLNIPCPGSMRAPGEAQGGFALESAIDELSYALGIDPLQLRLRNYAETPSAARAALVEQGAARVLRGRRASGSGGATATRAWDR